ncbi:SPOR domain-containing protein [Flavobacterium sp. W21_SRS_FM6]|uniref:SPOR domain-containing protein n=1 Tax=Flavobacterium sp. W21_SRS_FM6 TaxID=3240268 RepID=UPI003F91DE93
MAHKDYVARGRGKKAAPPPPPKRSLPWLRIIVTLSLVAGFIVFLWSIKGTSPDSPETEVVTKVAPPKEDALPDMPEEEWEFIKSLPEYTVEVEVEEQAKSTKRYLMQCGSFKVGSQAEELKAKIAFQGLEAQVRKSEGSSWYRVILGPYESKRKAETDRHQLQKSKINGCQIWNWNL